MEVMGGPKTFEFWRNVGGEDLVIFTHGRFRMTAASLKRWMSHMTAAVNHTGLPEKVPEATALFLTWCESFGNKMIEDNQKYKR